MSGHIAQADVPAAIDFAISIPTVVGTAAAGAGASRQWFAFELLPRDARDGMCCYLLPGLTCRRRSGCRLANGGAAVGPRCGLDGSEGRTPCASRAPTARA